MIKTIGDEVMIVGSDAGRAHRLGGRLPGACRPSAPLPRIAIHYGVALFRDGDYYGRDVNIASRVSARAAGGEVLVTRPVVEVARVGGGHLEFERIGEVRLKGFTESTEIFVARQRRRRTVTELARRGPGAGPARRRAVRWWSCTRAGATRPACSTSPCGSRRPPAVTALHVNYGLRDAADADERHCAALCERLGVQLDVRRPVRPGERRQPPGLGPRRALPRGRRPGGGARRRRRRRPHALRPGGDDPLPAGVLAEPARAAGDAARDGAPGPPAARVHARADRRLLHARGPELARGRDQRLRRLRAQPHPPRARAGARARSIPPRRTTCWRWPRSCATRPRCSTSSSPRRSRAARRSPLDAPARAAAGAAAPRRPAPGRRRRRRPGRRGGPPRRGGGGDAGARHLGAGPALGRPGDRPRRGAHVRAHARGRAPARPV